MTLGIHSTIESMTGHRPFSCPWASLYDPFVHRVVIAHEHFAKGRAVGVPRPSHRLMDGVSFYSRSLDSIEAQQLDDERKRLEAEAAKRGR